MLNLEKIVQQIDEFFAQNQGADAEALLKQSIVQAVQEEDDNALLTLLNELIGYYRETSQVEASFHLADQAITLLGQMGLEGTIPYATTLLNVANAYRAGGRLDDSLRCYEKTMEVYRRLLDPKDMLVASLYNNMSLLYQEKKQFAEAKRCLCKAWEIVSCHEEAYFELAVTYANLAATCLSLNEDREAGDYFRKAIGLFEQYHIEDAHYSAALSSLGTYEYKKGNYQEAAKHFRKAMDCMRRSLGENEYYHRLKENLEACERAMQAGGVFEGGQQAKTDRLVNLGNEGPNDGKQGGLMLCQAYYEAYGKPMLEEKFPAYLDRIAVGLVGEGSDCFGYDDEISRDHDWGPGFCMWITEEVAREIGGKLQEAYEQLPSSFRGYQRAAATQSKGRRGVQTINGFYGRLLGAGDWEKASDSDKSAPNLSQGFWQQATDASLAASVNGHVFQDPQGIFTGVRRALQNGYPEQIQYLKLAEGAATFSQTGQYNYGRMLKRSDHVTAQMMLGDCLKAAAKLCYYMENQYPPHDKWLVKGLENLEGCEEVNALLQEVVKAQKEQHGTAKEGCAGQTVARAVEALATTLAHKLYQAGYISDTDPYLDAHTPELLQKARYAAADDEALVEEIVKLEFAAFDKVRNVGGRASCQDDWFTFSIMRKSQYLTWNRTMLMQYLYDFQREFSSGHNLIEEKYGRMMESTAPEEYHRIKQHFPVIGEQKKAIIESIVQLQVGWMEEFEQHYPTLAGNARSVHTREDNQYNTSYETYLRGEISTYSDKMLELYGRYVVEYATVNKNLTYAIMGHSAKMYGYHSLEEAEEQLGRLRI